MASECGEKKLGGTAAAPAVAADDDQPAVAFVLAKQDPRKFPMATTFVYLRAFLRGGFGMSDGAIRILHTATATCTFNNPEWPENEHNFVTVLVKALCSLFPANKKNP